MSGRECKVFYKALDPSRVCEELPKYKKYIDGVALDDENIDTLEDLMKTVKNVYGNEFNVILMGSKDTIVRALNMVGDKVSKVIVASNNLKELTELGQRYGDYKNIEFGLFIVKPAINLTQFIKHSSVKFVVMPPALIRGRLISEAKARKINIIANPVNDVATYVRLLELGVSAVVTTDPTIKREARKILKL